MADADYTPEIWKTIDCAPSYEVSSFGRIRRVASGQGARPMLRKQDLERTGYLRVRVSEKGQRMRLSVHRLTAIAFLGQPPRESDQVAHYDGDKTNNRIENLRWATCRENILDKQRHGTQARGEGQGRAKLTNAAVAYIRSSGRRSSELAAELSISATHIARIRKRLNWRHI